MARLFTVFSVFTLMALPAAAQDIVLEDEVPEGAPPYFELPFEVPDGVVEIEVRHEGLTEGNILDWGVRDTERLRGWGGGNREPAVVGVEAASRSYLTGAMPSGTWAVLVGQAQVNERPARYRVEIFLRDAATLAPQTERTPYVPSPPLTEGPAWFAGDFHVHSRESGDAFPTLDEVAAFAAERGLDFVVLSEHNTTSQNDFIVDAQSRHPNVLFVPGVELTTYAGHANAIGTVGYIDFRVRSGIGVDEASIADAIEAEGGLFSINHPALDIGDLCLGCAWELDMPAERVGAVEVQNGAFSVTGQLFYAPSLALWERLLDTGAHVAAIGGSDDHRAGVGLSGFQSPIGSPTTMVYADALSAEAIVAGVLAGRTVVKLEGPADPMIELEAGEARIGDTTAARSSMLRARITGAEGMTLRFVRNGQALDPISVDADPFEATLELEAPPGDVDDRYRAQLEASRRARVVTGHIWVRATGEPPPPDAGSEVPPDGDEGGCGCRASRPRPAPLGLVSILIAIVCLRPRVRRRVQRSRAAA